MCAKNIRIAIVALILIVLKPADGMAQDKLTGHIIIVQPIVTQSDEGDRPASIAIPEESIDRAYQKADIDFYFLEPIYFNNTAARDGLINLDSICILANNEGLIKGVDDVVNMFFVNAVDGQDGPLGRGMFGGNITFIALGKEVQPDLEAFVIGHEVAHNLSLGHVVDDPALPDTVPNLMGDGLYSERIDPKYSLVQSQIEKIMLSPLVHERVELLSVESGKEVILDESFEGFYKNLQHKEISAFTRVDVLNKTLTEARQIARDEFSGAVMEFSDLEKEALEWLVLQVDSVLIQNQLAFVANHPWRFVKVNSNLCSGFAYTLGTCIILSENHLDHLSENWSEKMADSTSRKLISGLGSLIVHEQLHSIQRTFPSKFDRLYQDYWGFVKADVDIESYDLLITNQVSNPDAPVANYLIPDNNNPSNFYWVRTIFKETSKIPKMGVDFTDIVYEVTKNNGNYNLKINNETGNPFHFDIKAFTKYKNRFPVTSGIDHPNEISAYMLSQLYVSKLYGEIPFNDVLPEAKKSCQQFLRWADEEISKKALNISHL